MILFHDLAMHAVESTAHSENKITWNMIHDRMRSTMYELTKMKFMVSHAIYIVHKSCVAYTCKVLHVQVHVMYTCKYTSCTRHVHVMYTSCTLHVHVMYTSCTRHVHVQVHVMYTSCTRASTRHVHVMYTSCTRHVHVMHTSCTRASFGYLHVQISIKIFSLLPWSGDCKIKDLDVINLLQDPKADGEEKILKSYAELAEKLREEFRSFDD